ncbi:MAG: two-component system response regulator [Zetaproteobacteria bacterium CG12_big_fil_rev_8_21_14_0_65_54_13]|nr:MAG: two-component system response regulator [Zetaproteobacteria bacterium CG23_combo_of_CG06-09_8_20_14_all_54_7]PIW51503.1 MAG: two-component system response regulator [Zetaproteobacteria bacterium CG12_big_fil_rev_8_21_14_0_65_54_13]PIX55357.1 MAG: two-component system response regulator [Zetaproteobacteria bacterium CG_4_10_14_3_um_filter_54_28]PJA27297.1 MAG: two-component system response regulator [Zetaproteobacteria bacterium CG_4_9_14_3_um_filter_54_145]
MSDARLLLVDDDLVFCQVLGRALKKRGFDVFVAHSVEQALALLDEDDLPAYAVVDLSMPGSSGLVLVEHLRGLSVDLRIVVLTGYASIATAVEAIKLGATHYLAKPANADEIVQAFGREQGDVEANVSDRPSVRLLEWEHIQKVLSDCEGNISAAARELGMHRRTLQRKLAKRPPKS